ncbi:MAG: CopD family protein [Methylobacteriaceae bacterium]|nr:CopD family protein [Methylobacteriaceae bacterium]
MIDTSFVAFAAARWIHFASVMLLFGASLFPFYALAAPQTAPELAHACGALRAAAVIALLSGIAWVGATFVSITGEMDSLIDPDALGAFFLATGFGKIWLLRLVLLVALLVAALIARPDVGGCNSTTATMAVLSASLLVSQGWIGHPAASIGSERWIVTAGYALHVLGAGAWLGGLLPLGLVLRARNADARGVETALHRFSAAGMFAIALILIGGLINAWARWGSLDALAASAWGKVLLVKAVGFTALVALASVNRFILMPRLAAHGCVRTKLARNVMAEQAIGLAILAAAACLGILPPPA